MPGKTPDILQNSWKKYKLQSVPYFHILLSTALPQPISLCAWKRCCSLTGPGAASRSVTGRWQSSQCNPNLLSDSGQLIWALGAFISLWGALCDVHPSFPQHPHRSPGFFPSPFQQCPPRGRSTTRPSPFSKLTYFLWFGGIFTTRRWEMSRNILVAICR